MSTWFSSCFSTHSLHWPNQDQRLPYPLSILPNSPNQLTLLRSVLLLVDTRAIRELLHGPLSLRLGRGIFRPLWEILHSVADIVLGIRAKSANISQVPGHIRSKVVC